MLGSCKLVPCELGARTLYPKLVKYLAVVPAGRASQLDPVESLRYE
jgi:hypothetical protein